MHWRKITGKQAEGRDKLYEVRDRADGIHVYFKTQKEAEEFTETHNVLKRNRAYNHPATNKELKKWTAQQLILSYMKSSEFKIEEADYEEDRDEFIDASPLQENLSQVLWKISFHPDFKKRLFDFTPEVAQRYYDEMTQETFISNGSEQEKTYSHSTINRNHVTVLKKVWDSGKAAYRLSGLSNPWREVKTIKGGFRRHRGLKKGELNKLIKHSMECRGSNSSYIPLAIYILVDTGMRRQEIFDLAWSDIDFEARTIHIKHDKNSWRRKRDGLVETGRVICLPPLSYGMLLKLAACLTFDGTAPGYDKKIPKEFHPPDGKIFMNTEGQRMTGNGFKQAFEEICKRADEASPDAKYRLYDPDPKKRLTPHSLRAGARMTFKGIKLQDSEIDFMENGVKNAYDVIEQFLEIVHRSLDIAFYGKPFNEVEKDAAVMGGVLTSALSRLAEEAE